MRFNAGEHYSRVDPVETLGVALLLQGAVRISHAVSRVEFAYSEVDTLCFLSGRSQAASFAIPWCQPPYSVICKCEVTVLDSVQKLSIEIVFQSHPNCDL